MPHAQESTKRFRKDARAYPRECAGFVRKEGVRAHDLHGHRGQAEDDQGCGLLALRVETGAPDGAHRRNACEVQAADFRAPAAGNGFVRGTVVPGRRRHDGA